jgi:hypothetical protein
MFCCAGKAVTYRAGEITVPDDVEAAAGRAPAEDNVVREAAGVRQAEPVQCPGQGWPGIRVRTVTRLTTKVNGSLSSPAGRAASHRARTCADVTVITPGPGLACSARTAGPT